MVTPYDRYIGQIVKVLYGQQVVEIGNKETGETRKLAVPRYVSGKLKSTFVSPNRGYGLQIEGLKDGKIFTCEEIERVSPI